MKNIFVYEKRKRSIRSKRRLRTGIAAFLICVVTVTGCNTKPGADSDNIGEIEADIQSGWTADDGYIAKAEVMSYDDASLTAPPNNPEATLSVPTYVTQIDDKWFIVDCYHDRIIYNDNLTAPLYEWKVLTDEAKQPHTMAGDGQVILVDDTENNRVLVYECRKGIYLKTQVFENIGQRPHYTVYDSEEKAFYVWSSTTGEMYVFRHEAENTTMYLTEIRSVGDGVLNGTYIRSFYLEGDSIYFVSGIKPDGTSSGIIRCDKNTLEIRETYEVPNNIAGMAAMRRDGNYYYITVSTDVTGSQDAATMIRTADLSDLKEGGYEEIYSAYFVGGGTPYNLNRVGDMIYLTEHRLPGHAVWSYRIDDKDNIVDVQSVY